MENGCSSPQNSQRFHPLPPQADKLNRLWGLTKDEHFLTTPLSIYTDLETHLAATPFHPPPCSTELSSVY